MMPMALNVKSYMKNCPYYNSSFCIAWNPVKVGCNKTCDFMSRQDTKRWSLVNTKSTMIVSWYENWASKEQMFPLCFIGQTKVSTICSSKCSFSLSFSINISSYSCIQGVKLTCSKCCKPAKPLILGEIRPCKDLILFVYDLWKRFPRPPQSVASSCWKDP